MVTIDIPANLENLIGSGIQNTITMIKNFVCKHTASLFDDKPTRRFRVIERVARRKLEILAAAQILKDLRIPPGNRLESLKGDRKGQHSIRINDQWRICFRWKDGNAYDVGIIDYH